METNPTGGDAGSEPVLIYTSVTAPEKKSEQQVISWIKQEEMDLHSVMEVLKYDERYKDISQIDIIEADRLMQKKMGCRVGKWRKDGSLHGLKIDSIRDWTNLEILRAYMRDLCLATDHYLKWRRRRLNLMTQYVETDMTIDEFKIRDNKLTTEMSNNMPNNDNIQEAAQRVVAEANRRPDQLQDLVTKTAQARQALFESLKDVGSVYHEFKQATDAIAGELHAFRSSVVTDLSKAKSEMADVRKFFLSQDHAIEIARLREFLELCERLKALKDSGFLDAVADTILKLEVGKSGVGR